MSAPVAAWIALLAFPTLLLLGWARDELRPRSLMVFALLGLAAWAALPRLVPNGAGFVTPALALLDIALVFAIFHGDIRLT